MDWHKLWEKTKYGIERMNQWILCLPVWLVLVVGRLLGEERGGGWQKSEKNERYERMY